MAAVTSTPRHKRAQATASGAAAPRPAGAIRRLLEAQNEILELIARNAPSPGVLERLTRLVEELAPPALCSVLFLENGRLHHGAAPSLPAAYCRAIDGTPVGAAAGSCGTAAHLGERVVVTDIATDPLWADYREAALAAGLRACWSQPIMTESGDVLGTFALYAREPREPTAQDWELVESMAWLVRVLIDRDRREKALRAAERDLRRNERHLRDRILELEQTREHLQQKTDELEALAADLTEARNDAATASRMKSEFLANMSHELRTPLNAIIGFSDIMMSQTLGPLENEKYRNYVRDIHDSGEHLLQIISEVLDVSRIEAGRFELSESTVDLREVVGGCMRLVAERGRAAGVRLEAAIEEGLPLLCADQIKVKQVLLNLLSNAVKFTPKDGRVAVTARRAVGGGLEIEVADTGIGMRPEEIPIALEPFRQIENAFSRKYQGTGLGLPLAKAIVELHGGEMTIDSTAGVGTVVVTRFPPERTVLPAGRPA